MDGGFRALLVVAWMEGSGLFLWWHGWRVEGSVGGCMDGGLRALLVVAWMEG